MCSAGEGVGAVELPWVVIGEVRGGEATGAGAGGGEATVLCCGAATVARTGVGVISVVLGSVFGAAESVVVLAELLLPSPPITVCSLGEDEFSVVVGCCSFGWVNKSCSGGVLVLDVLGFWLVVDFCFFFG